MFFYNDLVLHAQVSVSVLRFAFPEGEVLKPWHRVVGNLVSFRETSVLPACKRSSTLPSGHLHWQSALTSAPLPSHTVWCNHKRLFELKSAAARYHPDLLTTPCFSRAHFTPSKHCASLVSNNCALILWLETCPGEPHTNISRSYFTLKPIRGENSLFCMK